MAMTGRLVADFSSFYDAVQKSETKLVEFTSGANKVGDALSRMTDRFSGRTVIQEALLMEKAIQNVGGVGALTGKQLQQVGAKASEALELMRKHGEKIPPGLQKIVDTAKPIPSMFQNITNTLGPLGTALAGAFTIRALTSAVTKTAEFGSQLADLSAKSGIGTTALQEFKYAGDQVGVSLDTITSAMGQFANRLGSGDKSALGAMKALGISFNEIRSMKPEDQFKLLADKLGDVTDQTAFVKVGMDLMGRGFLEVAPLIRADLDELIERAQRLGVVVGEETIKHLDDLDDTLTGLSAVGKAVMADFLAPFVPLITQTGQALMGFGNIMGDLQVAFEQAISVGARWSKWMTDAQISVLEFYNVGGLLDGRIKRLREESERYGAIAKDLSTTQTKVATETKKVDDAVKPLSVDYEQLAEKTKKAALEAEKYRAGLVGRVGLVEGTKDLHFQTLALGVALSGIGQSYDDSKLGPLAVAVDRVEQSVRRVVPEFSDLAFALEQVGKTSKVTMGDLDWMHAFVGPLQSAYDAAHRLQTPLEGMRTLLEGIQNDFAQMAVVAIRAFDQIRVIMDSTATAGKKFAGIATTSLAAGASIAGDNATGAALGGAAAGAGIGGVAAGAIWGSAAGPAGTAIGASAGAIIALVKWFKSNSAEKEVNKLRQSFVDAAGGLGRLDAEAQRAGVSLDRLLKSKSVKEYEAAINEVNAAIERHAARLKEAEEELGGLGESFNAILAGANIATDTMGDLGTIALSTYGAMTEAGFTHAKAIQSMHAGFAAMSETYVNKQVALWKATGKTEQEIEKLLLGFDRLGFAADNAALKVLLIADTILTKNPALLAAVEALGSQFDVLSKYGLLNVDTFGAMERTGLEMFGRIQSEVAAVGGSTRDALMPMQGFLHDAEEAAEALGIPMDEYTQDLISQSKEFGIWKDKGKTANELLIEGLEKLIDRMDKFLLRLGGIGPIPAPWENWEDPPGGRGDEANEGGGHGGRPMAMGGFGRVLGPTLFLAGEAGAEEYAFSGGGKSFARAAGLTGGALDGTPGGRSLRERLEAAYKEWDEAKKRGDAAGMAEAEANAKALWARIFGPDAQKGAKTLAEKLQAAYEAWDDARERGDAAGMKKADAEAKDLWDRIYGPLKGVPQAFDLVTAASQKFFGLFGRMSTELQAAHIEAIKRLVKGDQSTNGSGYSMAQGGMGRVLRPTLFLAGEAGAENFAFWKPGASRGGGNTVNVGDVVVQGQFGSEAEFGREVAKASIQRARRMGVRFSGR